LPDALEEARKIIQTRVRELEEESARLRKALAGLGGQAAARVRRRGRRASAKRPQRARKSETRRLGKRQEQFLDAVKKNPGARVSDLSRSIGIQPQQGYGIAASLRKQGRLKRSGKGYALKT
jgi:hypothetical protein